VAEGKGGKSGGTGKRTIPIIKAETGVPSSKRPDKY
jgi:hypothetical protein